MMDLDVIAFDLDGTLFDPTSALRLALAAGRLSGAVQTAARRAIEAKCPGHEGDIERSARLARRALMTAIRPDPELVSRLYRLRRRFRLVLVTDGGSVTQRTKVRALGLDEAFERIVVGGEHRMHKPNPRLLLRAVEGLAPAPRVLVVGDDPVRDIIPARGLGMRTWWIPRGTWPTSLPLPERHGHLNELWRRLGCRA